MNAYDLLDAIGSARDTYVDAAVKTRKTSPRRRISPRRVLLVALAAAMAALLVGCTVAYVLSLQELKIGESTYTQRTREFSDDGEMHIVETEFVRSMISLQGLEGTPGFQASKEWQEYEESLDPLEILRLHDEGASIKPPSEYDAYGVCTQEMMDKVDQIAAKYGLKLAGQSTLFQRGETDFFLNSLGLDQLHDPEQVHVEYADGYFYECGDFMVEFHLSMPQFPDSLAGYLRFHDKEYFYTFNASVTNIDSCRQWNYTLPDGQQLLIVRDDSNYTKVFCDREDAFLYLAFVDECNDEARSPLTLTDDDVMTVVKAFDFSIRPQKPEMDAAKD